MVKKMTRNAYAKLNLRLNVTGRRADGYHTVDTVMRSVSLCDAVSWEPGGDALRFSCSDRELEKDDNLCVRAADAFFRACGLPASGLLTLTKRIPCGAGLGGGSADAACVLRLLNDACGEKLSDGELYSLAAGLGADVPFCLHGGLARCGGIGERVAELPDDGEGIFVVAQGKERLSTAEMYRLLDGSFASGAEQTGDGYYNAFQPVAEALLPGIGALRRRLLSFGAEHALLTGSGSAVFGVFPEEKRASVCAESLRSEGLFAEVCRAIPRY